MNSQSIGGLTIPGFYNLSGSRDPVRSNNSFRSDERRGVFALGSLGFKSMLYLDSSYRLDWSSTAKPDDNRVETFGTSISFLAHKLFSKSDVITFSKLRAGYAQAPYFPGPYNVGSTYNVGSLYNGNGTLSVSNRQENPNLIGGTRTELEVGTELHFFENKLALDFTYFKRIDSDIPVTVPLDGSTGYVNGNVQDYSLPTRTVTGNQRYKSPIYTSAQVKLSLAEAKLKGWSIGSGTVESLLKEGIEESMRFWGVDELDINAYTDAHTSATLADIAYEKWVALYLNGPETWAEWRRLDMPVLIPSGNAVDPRIPVRDAYDSSIEDNNSANYASIISIQGPDNLHTKLWWDKN